MKLKPLLIACGIAAAAAVGYAGTGHAVLQMGRQPDGSYIVSTGQRIEPNAIAFSYRPIDLALHPSGDFFAVLNQQNVFLATRDGVIAGSTVPLAEGAGYRGAAWSPDGMRLFVSISAGYLQALDWDGERLSLGARIAVKPEGAPGNPRPGGMAITRDGSRLFVVTADRNAVAEIDLANDRFVREYPVQNIPFQVRLSGDEKTLIVSDWGGRQPTKEDETSPSGGAMIVVDPRGVPASGAVSLIARDSGKTTTLSIGLHPTDIVVDGDRAYVANAASDTISEISLSAAKVTRTLPIRWGRRHVFGSMPDALALRGRTLFVCDGGDNALCEMDLAHGTVRGFRPAGYFPTALALSKDGKTAFVLNTKGNGSVRRTGRGEPGNVHDFQGSVSVIDLTGGLLAATAKVAADNHWQADPAALHPPLAVYRGAIKHVLYIIKENRTYDEVFGDMKEGNGDPALCDLGERITPNAHALARQFALFDNAYVSGTNSADGHAWSTQALCNDYLEHFYAGYRTYPDDGDCAMSRSSGGCLWDDALKAGKSFRDYGEYCDEDLAKFTPLPKNWMDVWQDRVHGTHHIQIQVGTWVPSLKKYIHPSFVYWPLLQSDQARADLFIEEYHKLSRQDRVPDLMVMALPCDHTEGRNPDYPQPQCMVADNDLALGRIVEAISHSPQWKETCIFVIEDDAQSGPDHVDGHRTVTMALSPYTRRRSVDHEFGTTLSMLRSIELMLGLPPMNRFDALTPPLTECFTDRPDLAPYTVTPNQVALDQMNPPVSALKGKARYWTERSLALDWSGPDRADPQVLNQVLWHTLHGMDTPYQGTGKREEGTGSG
ncbi:MAG TPA: bifunctional YncE family protein/alkaline phosphatase family protein [Chthonomonadaceae bacterium]|nr:bifunctional YncE family protein/alkaline phosphatase family protein [Chthonomonadaceae bacterium]